MRDAISICAFIASGAITGLAFHEYWALGWAGLVFFAWASVCTDRVSTTLVGSYLAGLLFNILAANWLLGAVPDAQPLVLFHWLAVAWLVTALILRVLWRRGIPACAAFPLAWTVGVAIPLWAPALMFGPPGHFEMNRLAQTQVDLRISQIADVAGMAGIEFIMAAAVGAVVDVLLLRRQARTAVLAFMLVGAAWLYGQIRSSYDPDGTIEVALYGGLLPRDDKLGGFPKADLFVWPEMACREEWRPALEANWRGMARHLRGTIVAGVARSAASRTYNSVLIGTDNRIDYVDKRYLVMGGENLSPVELILGPSPDRQQLIDVGSAATAQPRCGPVALAIPICYEIAVPQAVRDLLGPSGRSVIVNPGCERRLAEGAGALAMLNHARLRAIESRRPVVRAVIGGYTAIIDGSGRVIASVLHSDENVDTPLVGSVPLDSRFSLYRATGDWLTLASCVFAAGLLLLTRRPSGVIPDKRSRYSELASRPRRARELSVPPEVSSGTQCA